jgi:thymidylate kinase
MSLHPLLVTLFQRWDEAGCAWALLRMPADPAAPEGDLDLLLEADTAPAALDAAGALGFVPVPGYGPDTHLLQFHRETGRWLWLHCATELAFGPYRAVRPGVEAELLAARGRAGPVARLAAGHEFWITLMHALLDQGRITDGTRRRLRESGRFARPAGPLPEALGPLLPAGWSPERLSLAVTAEDWTALDRIAPAMRRQALRRARPPLPSRALRAVGRRLSGRHSRRPPGISVALLGPDGAGKSTLAAGLQQASVFPVRQVYMGLTGGWLRHVDRLRVPGIVKVGRLCVIWGRYLRGRYHTWRGRLVVFDRYVFDAAVPPPYRLGRAGRLARWIDGHSCPAPDLVLILDAPGDVMHLRKGEYDAAMLEDWRRRFRSLEQRLRHVAVLDTSRPAERVRDEAMALIWRRYVQRWGRK